MALHKPICNRKPASCCINDDTEMNLMQLSPVRRPYHVQQSSSKAATTCSCSRSNFIEKLKPTEIPRVFSVNKTGEKHFVDLDDSSIPKAISPRFSAPTIERIYEKSLSQLSLTEKSNKSSSKLNKTPLKRYKKYRLLCTPRNMDIASLSRPLIPYSNRDKTNSKLTQNTSVETQTEDCSARPFSSYMPKQYNKFTAGTDRHDYIPMEGPRNFNIESAEGRKRFYNTSTLPDLENLKIYTTSNHNLIKHSELRNLASALTLITVFYWLFSTIFDVECSWDYLESLWQYFHNWFSPEERPKTKVEILIAFLEDMWS